uniref:Protein kinase C-binding protein 1 n=1 Tax=Anopheles epiroticus TaxID=199890 RepID=A0A182PKP0_9DIPT
MGTVHNVAGVMQSSETQMNQSRNTAMQAEMTVDNSKASMVTEFRPNPAGIYSQSSDELAKRHETVPMETSCEAEAPKDQLVATAEFSAIETSNHGGHHTQEAEQQCKSIDRSIGITNDESAGEIEVGSTKPSREMKLLQQTQSKSKVLTEIMTEAASRKGKLRKRRSDSTYLHTTYTGTRKRNQSRSAALNSNSMSAEGNGGENGEMADDDYVPLSGNRKIRSAKSEYTLQKVNIVERSNLSGNKDDSGSIGGPSSLFQLSNINLEMRNNTEESLPGDPPKNVFHPLDKSTMPNYDKYITYHVDLSVMHERLVERKYKSPDEFISDVNWLVHNMTIYPANGQLLKIARALQKRAKQEIEEMEPCHECYIKANNKTENWFKVPCSKPHLLVWAKLKGYPYWPGKLYGINASNQANVRFFGAHDRAWLPVKDCFLFSQRDPNQQKPTLKTKHMSSFTSSMEDMEDHIARLRERFQTFNYAESFELVDPSRLEDQQRAMLPGAFLKKVKLTIKRTEGEMVAVDTSSEYEMPPVSNILSSPTNIDIDSDKTVIPRKRMTRRMSRILKNPDGLDEKLTNTSKDTTDEQQDDSHSSNNLDTTDESSVSGSKSVEAKKHKLHNDDRQELSLLLRRGSQSWGTEPLSKRRKSTVDKGVSAGPKTAPSNVTELENAGQQDKLTPEGLADRVMPDGQKEIEVPNSQPTVPIRTVTKHHALVSIPVESSAQFITQKEKETAISIAAIKDTSTTVGTPAATSSNIAPADPNPSDMSSLGDISIKEEIIFDDDITIESCAKIEPSATNKVSPPSEKNDPKDLGSTVAIASSVADVVSQQLSPVSLTIHTVATAFDANVADGVSNTIKQAPIMPVNAKDTNSTNSKTITATKANYSTTSTKAAVMGGNSKSSVAVLGPNRQQATSSANKSAKGNVSNGVPDPTDTSLITTNTPVVVVPSNQRARKSFPGGAANSKNGAPKPTANSSNDTGSLAWRNSSVQSLRVDKRNENTMVTKASKESNILNQMHAPVQATSAIVPSTATNTKRTVDTSNSVNAISSAMVPQQLVPSSTTISLISPTADNNTENDDVMIIDEDIPTQGQSRMSSRRVSLPPLVPRPQLQGSSIQPTDSGERLARPTELLNDCAAQLMDNFRSTIENVLSDLAAKGSLSAEVAILKVKLDQAQKLCEQQANELEAQRIMFDDRLQELRKSLEQEKKIALNEQRKQMQQEKVRAVQITKQKQWCKRCHREAKFYCCWNTSYCDMTCQEKHWDEHKDTCNQVKEKKARSSLAMSIVPAVPDHCWVEDDSDCSSEHAGNSRSVQLIPPTTSITISPDNKNSSRNKYSTATTARVDGSPDRGKSSNRRKKVPPSSTTGSMSARGEPNSANTSIPSNGVVPAATSTPIPATGRSHPVANISYATPTIKSVYSRDPVAGFLQNPSQNGGNTSAVVSTAPLNISHQQQQKRRGTSERRDNSIISNNVSQGFVPTSVYDLTLASPRITTVLQPLASSTTDSMTMPTYRRVTTPSGDNSGLSVPQNVWNQIALQASVSSRQLHLGNAGGQSAVEFRPMPHQPTIVPQMQKPAREQ